MSIVAYQKKMFSILQQCWDDLPQKKKKSKKWQRAHNYNNSSRKKLINDQSSK